MGHYVHDQQSLRRNKSQTFLSLSLSLSLSLNHEEIPNKAAQVLTYNRNVKLQTDINIRISKSKGKVFPLQARCGPEGG